MSGSRFVVDEVFRISGRPGPLVVGRAEELDVERCMHLVLEDEQGSAAVEVLSVEFATPRTSAEGTTTLMLSSDLDGRVHPGVELTSG